ncbi:maleylacetoacetate isomerase-like [Pollicipes pollicipes]|uniref:maleylacetoacetate isomerase-like n=1 Tax=Pollicipes pollicipes TaxID=41117 RepID=UPI0018852542|nr:maleylacetoacetate isomerase-like [Pollicipes pollicipes]
MKLYSFFMSSCAWRVRVVLQAKGVEHEYVAVNLLTQEQRDAAFLRVNPLGQVPVLVDGDLVLTQSLAMLEYLEEKYPTPALLPSETAQRAQVRNICEMINSGMQPVQSGAFRRLNEIGGEGAGLAWGREAIERGFEALEAVLACCAGRCCVGDRLSLADCCLVPQVFNARRRFGVDVSRFPTISRLQDALLQRPEFVASHPARMPDCPAGFSADAPGQGRAAATAAAQ